MHKLIEEWTSEFSNQKTRKDYQRNINKFLTAANLTIEQLQKMTPEQIKHIILKYRADTLTAGTGQNSVLTYINAVRSFATYINKPIRFRRGSLGKFQADTTSHIFSNGDLKTLFDNGDTQQKAIITTATSLGWEVSAFINELTRERIKQRIEHAIQNGEKYIFFEQTREKTKEKRFAVLNPLAIEWLTKYLQLTENQPRHKTDPRLFIYSTEGVNRMLGALAIKSGLKTTGQIRFHNIRKWLMSRLSRCGFGEFQIKYILGKAIPVSDSTYLQTLKTDVEEKYPLVYNDYLNICPVLVSETTNKQFEGLKRDFELFKAAVAPIAVLYEDWLRKMVKTRDFHVVEMVRLEALGSPLAGEARENKEALDLKVEQMENALKVLRGISATE